MKTQPRQANGAFGPIPIEQRFAASVKKASSGCIEWQRPTNKGYGEIIFNGRLYKAHQIALMLRGIPIPEGMEVCHKCDNPKCVNIEHLEIATHKKNMLDAIKRGLWSPQLGWKKMMRVRRVRYGEYHHSSKITLNDVTLIRKLRYRRGLFSDLGKMFGVSCQSISDIYKRRSWKKGNAIRARAKEVENT